MGALEGEDGGAEGIRLEPLLSIWVLEGLLPVDRRELGRAAVRPSRQQAEEITQVRAAG